MNFIFIIYLVVIFYSNEFIIKKKLMSSATGFGHQLFSNVPVPLTGGIFIVIPIIYLFFFDYTHMTYAYLLLFILGTMSDLNILSSSKKRFFIQFTIILLFIFITKLEVLPTRILFIDHLFENQQLSLFFTIFCFLVLINGSNFIDGLNGLLLGYLLIIYFYLFKLGLIEFIELDNENFFYFILLFIFLLILNFNNKLFLGDSGAYSLSFLTGFILIKIYNLNNYISPYFIILLLWYPCFENLFSIIRKFIFRLNPIEPDNKHLHQYLFIYLKKKYKISNLLSNNISSIIINIFNFLILFVASQNISHTKIQLVLLLFCLLSYLGLYKFLKLNLKLS